MRKSRTFQVKIPLIVLLLFCTMQVFAQSNTTSNAGVVEKTNQPNKTTSGNKNGGDKDPSNNTQNYVGHVTILKKNATADNAVQSTECPKGYYRKGTECLPLPTSTTESQNYVGHVTLLKKNATAGNAVQSTECPKGYYRKGTECLPLPTSTTESQNYGHITLLRFTDPIIFLGSGILNTTGDLKTNTGIKSLTDLNLSAYIPIKSFANWSWGFEAGGGYSFSDKDVCPTVEPFQITGQNGSPTIKYTGTASSKSQGFRLAAGPAAAVSLGSKFLLIPSLNAVYGSFQESKCSITQTSMVNGTNHNWDLCDQTTQKSSGIGVLPKVKLVYQIGRIGIWAEAGYLMGQKMTTTTTTLVPEGNIHADGTYSVGQMNNATYATTVKNSNFSAIGVNGGISIALGKPKQDPPLSTPTTSGGTIPMPKAR